MALIDCPECEKRISDKASSCPSCGYPLAKEHSDRRREAFFLDPLADLAEFAEQSIHSLREALDRGRRREKKEEPGRGKDGEEKGPE